MCKRNYCTKRNYMVRRIKQKQEQKKEKRKEENHNKLKKKNCWIVSMLHCNIGTCRENGRMCKLNCVCVVVDDI